MHEAGVLDEENALGPAFALFAFGSRGSFLPSAECHPATTTYSGVGLYPKNVSFCHTVRKGRFSPLSKAKGFPQIGIG